MTPRRGFGTPMPEGVRALARAHQHPARAVDCPHCGAHDRAPCTTRSGRRRLTLPHSARVTAWVVATAVCPESTCQVAPGVPCHRDGRQLDDPHPARRAEAEETT